MFSRNSILIVPLLIQEVVGLKPPIPGYKTQDITWQIEVFPGQEHQNFTGTIENVISEVQKRNTAFKLDPPEIDILSKRYQWDFGDLICGGGPYNWQWAKTNYVTGGIKYLRSIKGKPHLPAGPGTCGRVSCGDKASIWWCNDRDDFTEHYLTTFAEIALGAERINDVCRTETRKGWLTVGQIFTNQKWNVIVREDRNDC
ncbi:uncharacterized protein UV8b_06038 [Ustilaginoidea virens]|uniref:Ecp2 effector protein domain-containing protein n=1 Tax=Ustilaginoidea virens TaxID=1159556 RepID=A0A8E5MJ77_USTVR|nr:uncharacterized protein UV8b_06038 [Ustilaginoidea virens]QUC21797.1 hypothetical protein UV8b_06038 [Ustilaginoidea virens]